MASASALLRDKVREQVERTQHLLALVPGGALDWRPPTQRPCLSVGELLGHLLECLAGLCAALHAANPGPLAHFQELRALPVNHACGLDEARGRIAEYLARIEEGFAALTDAQLLQLRPTVFVPEGEALLTLLLGNLEHLINHKHQLFLYLRLLGVGVATPDLYKLRA